MQQRIDAISGLIIATAKRVLITHNIKAKVPTELHELFEQLLTLVIDSQATFIESIEKFKHLVRDVIKLIHKSEEQENQVDNVRSQALEILFKIANEGSLKMGDFSSLEGLIEYIEDISDAIKSATTSLDWLLFKLIFNCPFFIERFNFSN